MSHEKSSTLVLEHAAESLRNRQTVPLFDLGQVVLTAGVRERLDADLAASLLSAHSSADWGNAIDSSDADINNSEHNVKRLPLEHGGKPVLGPGEHPFETWTLSKSGRVFGVWKLPTTDEDVWVVSENGQDGVVTTILFASEY